MILWRDEVMGKRTSIPEVGLKLCTGIYHGDEGLKSFQIEEECIAKLWRNITAWSL